MEVNGQEILTKGKVSLRVNLSATWQVLDAEKVKTELADHYDLLYRELQLALRAAVSTQTLDELLADENLLDQQVQSINEAKFNTAFQCVGASHDLCRPDIDFRGPPDVPPQVVLDGRLRASAVFMIFSTLCYMRSEHLERGLDDVSEGSPLRPFRNIYRAGSIKRGDDTLVQVR